MMTQIFLLLVSYNNYHDESETGESY